MIVTLKEAFERNEAFGANVHDSNTQKRAQCKINYPKIFYGNFFGTYMIVFRVVYLVVVYPCKILFYHTNNFYRGSKIIIDARSQF